MQRNRNDLDAMEQKIEPVTPEDFDVALSDFVRSGFSIAPDSARSPAMTTYQTSWRALQLAGSRLIAQCSANVGQAPAHLWRS